MNRKRKERLSQQVRDKIFMKQLGKELREQDNDGQAYPRYWSIMDYKWVEDTVNPERTVVYDADAAAVGEISEYVKTFLEDLDEDELLEKAEWIESLYLNLELNDFEDVKNILQDEFGAGDLYLYEESLKDFIVPNSMFLTKEEAKQHLKSNHYHYHKDAHTYAMTAWRAPKVERLLRILEENK
ncbi:MAG: hypothetical protein ABS862_01220 [Carnobacterium inhibens]|uniref:hypothetical protein n=1 Tax=Carnobacterium sp. TaxID=48221 RepID=UPI003314CAE0